MSAAVRIGKLIILSGVVAVDDSGAIDPEADISGQIQQCFKNINATLDRVGCDIHNVVQLRCYLTVASNASTYLRIRKEIFGDSPPATTTVVCGLLDERYLVELEAIAWAPRE